MRLQGIVSRELPATDPAVVTVGVLHAGTKENAPPAGPPPETEMPMHDQRNSSGSRPARQHNPVPGIVNLASASQDNADAELLAGLRSKPRSLPSRLGYDDKGSRLYAEMMRVPSYYLVRAERELLSQHATAMLETSEASAIVDLGAGTAEKTELLLSAFKSRDGAGLRAPGCQRRGPQDRRQPDSRAPAVPEAYAAAG
jgi:hypothetical protein